jgi:cytochrome b subunit of formate dehydrogenase
MCLVSKCRYAGVMVAVTLLGIVFAARAQDLIKNSECMDCHGDKTLTTTNSAGREISLFTDLAKLAASVHRTNTCVSCHADLTRKHPDDNVPAKKANCAACHERQSQSYDASVHGAATRSGSLIAATCSDCHDSHLVLPPSSPESPLHFSKLAATCGACHDQEAKDVAVSVHGTALAAGHREAPTCTDCHSEHKIVGLKNASSLQISVEVCSKCHASERLNTKYNLPQDRVKTFFESYHGLASQYGSTLAANCASCHGVHKILPSGDPRSTINPAHLVETCGKCHPGATENFALGKIHVAAADAAVNGRSGAGEQINWWVRRIYLVLIAGVIGGMLVHNGLLMARKLAAINRARRRPVLRMNRSQRVQHGLLALSFVALAITGFALKYPDSWVAWLLGSSEPFRRLSHRVAAVVLLATGAWHIVYVIFTREGRQLVKDFYPRLQDARDVLRNLWYLFGWRRDKARIGRFGYAEKMEYWAVVWGTIIMGVTGLMIWFKIDVTQYLPRWMVDVALNIHYYEAILACLAIVVWHFYHVIFDPDVYPLNPACWDGRVTEHWQEEEHPLEKPQIVVEPPVAPVAEAGKTAAAKDS